jgi:CheY-like chemotaxis protein
MSQHTVMVVEDAPPIRALLIDLLRGEGYAVVEARDGIEAIRLLDEQCSPGDRPAVVLLDMMLPRLDGVAVLRDLAQQGDTTPVVAMSASSQHLGPALAAGAQAALQKPFDLGELLAVVARYCA